MSGVEKGTISALEVRDSSRSAHFAALAKALNTTVEGLGQTETSAEGGKDVLSLSAHKETLSSADLMEVAEDTVVMRQFDAIGSMGSGVVLANQPGVIRTMSVSQEWAEKNLPAHTGFRNLCIVTGFGDSMKGMFNSGDPLICDEGVKSVDYDAVYFFRVGEEGFIKRLQRIPGEGIRVISANREYEPWTVKRGMDFEVFGRILIAWNGEVL